jgi:hypothetical protein
MFSFGSSNEEQCVVFTTVYHCSGVSVSSKGGIPDDAN